MGNNNQGFILTIGNRKSLNYYRIYETYNGVRFALEMKQTLIQNLSDTLVTRLVKEFEDRLTKHFYSHSKKILILHDE